MVKNLLVAVGAARDIGLVAEIIRVGIGTQSQYKKHIQHSIPNFAA